MSSDNVIQGLSIAIGLVLTVLVLFLLFYFFKYAWRFLKVASWHTFWIKLPWLWMHIRSWPKVLKYKLQHIGLFKDKPKIVQVTEKIEEEVEGKTVEKEVKGWRVIWKGKPRETFHLTEKEAKVEASEIIKSYRYRRRFAMSSKQRRQAFIDLFLADRVGDIIDDAFLGGLINKGERKRLLRRFGVGARLPTLIAPSSAFLQHSCRNKEAYPNPEKLKGEIKERVSNGFYNEVVKLPGTEDLDNPLLSLLPKHNRR